MNIILVHGILGFSRIAGIDYFRGVAQHFREKGHRVLAPTLDPTRGIAYRGTQLKQQIEAALAAGTLDRTQPAHIIAHSMGGLDSRYMLSPANPDRINIPIRSLTSISAPHHGTAIADLAEHAIDLIPFPHLRFGPGDSMQSVLDKLGISRDGMRELKPDYCRQMFNPKYVDAPEVAYFSVAGSGRASFPHTCAPLVLFGQYLTTLTGEANDGLVTVPSAQWGTFDRNTWPADHIEEAGYNLDNLWVPPSFPYLAKYDQLLANVAGLT